MHKYSTLIKRIILLCIFAGVSSLVAFALYESPETGSLSPVKAATVLSEESLAALPYRYDGISWIGSSDYKLLNQDGSNVAYYIEGTETDVKKAWLVLNIQNPSTGVEEKQLLQELASKLLNELGIENSKEMFEAISNEMGYNQSLENWSISVFAQKWPTGKGRDIKFKVTRTES